MDRDVWPYLGTCGFCHSGLLRFLCCEECDTIVVVCDECELLWSDIPAVFANRQQPSTGSYPTCPSSGSASTSWQRLKLTAVRRAGLGQYVAGFARW